MNTNCSIFFSNFLKRKKISPDVKTFIHGVVDIKNKIILIDTYNLKKKYTPRARQLLNMVLYVMKTETFCWPYNTYYVYVYIRLRSHDSSIDMKINIIFLLLMPTQITFNNINKECYS